MALICRDLCPVLKQSKKIFRTASHTNMDLLLLENDYYAVFQQ